MGFCCSLNYNRIYLFVLFLWQLLGFFPYFNSNVILSFYTWKYHPLNFLLWLTSILLWWTIFYLMKCKWLASYLIHCWCKTWPWWWLNPFMEYNNVIKVLKLVWSPIKWHYDQFSHSFLLQVWGSEFPLIVF